MTTNVHFRNLRRYEEYKRMTDEELSELPASQVANLLDCAAYAYAGDKDFEDRLQLAAVIQQTRVSHFGKKPAEAAISDEDKRLDDEFALALTENRMPFTNDKRLTKDEINRFYGMTDEELCSISKDDFKRLCFDIEQMMYLGDRLERLKLYERFSR
jgi:hypothetical protein